MIKFITMIVAENIIQDVDTKRISLVNIIEDVASEGLPLTIPQLCILLITEREKNDDTEYEFGLTIKLDDTILATSKPKAYFRDSIRHNLKITILGFIIPKPGRVEFIFYKEDGEILGEYGFNVTLRDQKPMEIKNADDQ